MKVIRVLRCHWDRTVAAVCVIGGMVAIVVAAVRARDSVLAFEQITFLISGGVVGLALVAIGLAAWISADLRDEWRQMRSLEQAIREEAGRSRDAHTDPPRTGSAPAPDRYLNGSRVEVGELR